MFSRFLNCTNSTKLRKTSHFSLGKPIDSHWFKLSCFDLLDLQLCLLFFLKTMKLCKGICSAWISRTSAAIFLSEIDVINVSKINRSIFILERTLLWIFGKWFDVGLHHTHFSYDALPRRICEKFQSSI